MLDGMIDQYWVKVKPHLSDAAMALQCYGDEVLRRLDSISDGVNEEDRPNLNHVYKGTAPAAAGAHYVLTDNIPVGREFELTWVSLQCGLTTDTTSLHINYTPVVKCIGNGGFNAVTDGGGLVLRGGDVLSITTNLAGNGATFCVVARERDPQTRRPSRGQISTDNTVEYASGEHMEVARHARSANISNGTNVIGASRDDR